MSDLIDRQAAIDAIIEDKICDDSLKIMIALGDGDKAETLNMTCDRHVKMLMSLPSAQLERPIGKWIVTSEFEDCRYAKCNQCKVTQVFYYGKPLTNYCPECGSYNGGEQE